MIARPLDLPRTPEAIAAHWFGVKRSGVMSGEEVRELEDWLSRDPENRAAFDELEQVWAVTAAARDDPEMMVMREAAARAHSRRPRVILAGGIAASLAALAVAGWVALGRYQPATEQAFHTGVGQTTTVTLPDGSVVTLDTDTALRTRESGRRRLVELERGQAFFRVAKDASRPFVVAAAGKTVTATGTAFDVRIDPDRMDVTMVEGRVRVEEPRQAFRGGQSADLLAGWRLTARANGRWSLGQADLARQTGWLSGRLAFNNEPLSAVVAELNRYSVKQIVIRDQVVANTPVIGAFKAGDVDDFVRAVKAYRYARVAADSERTVELAAP